MEPISWLECLASKARRFSCLALQHWDSRCSLPCSASYDERWKSEPRSSYSCEHFCAQDIQRTLRHPRLWFWLSYLPNPPSSMWSHIVQDSEATCLKSPSTKIKVEKCPPHSDISSHTCADWQGYSRNGAKEVIILHFVSISWIYHTKYFKGLIFFKKS